MQIRLKCIFRRKCFRYYVSFIIYTGYNKLARMHFKIRWRIVPRANSFELFTTILSIKELKSMHVRLEVEHIKFIGIPCDPLGLLMFVSYFVFIFVSQCLLVCSLLRIFIFVHPCFGLSFGFSVCSTKPQIFEFESSCSLDNKLMELNIVLFRQ